MKTNNTWVDYKKLKSSISILSVLQAFKIELPTQNGNQFYGSCPLPLHAGDGDNKQAFSVNAEKNCWRCITHCQGGNVLDLYCRLTNRDQSNKTDFRDAALEMQQRFLGESVSSSEFPKPQIKQPQKKIEKKENSPISITLKGKQDIPYLLEEKKLPLELLEEFGICFCARGMFSGRVVIPIHSKEGELLAYAGRGMKESDIVKRGRWMLPSGFSKSSELFNQHRASKRDIDQFGLVVVEGFWSCLRWHLAGMPVVALMGSEMSDAQLQRILELTDRVWLMLDNDEVGKKFSQKIVSRLADCVFVRRIGYSPDSDRYQPEDFTPDELRSFIPV